MTIQDKYLQQTGEIVSSYIANNTLPVDELPALIRRIYAALVECHASEAGHLGPQRHPPIAITKSVTDEHIVCLEDGQKFKSLKRHLRSKYDMSPDEYRSKWGLPASYPMVAPSYAKRRSELAKNIGLGRHRSKK